MLKRLLTVALVVAAAGTGGAGMQDPIDKIREADLKADLFALAGDAMRGREGGTLDEMTASAWVAERAREAGLLPAGDNGTYFQFFPLERFRVSAGSTVTLGGKALRMGRDVVTDAIVLPSVDAPVDRRVRRQRRGPRAQGSRARRPLRAGAAAGAESPGPGNAPALRTWLRGIQRAATASAPAAIVAIVPDAAVDQWDRVAIAFPRGTYGLDPDGTAEPRVAPRGMPLLYVRESALGGADRDRRAAGRVDLHRQLHLSVRQRHRQGAGPRRAARRTSTCSSARTRITTASAIR